MSWLKGAHQPRRPRSLRKNLEALGGPLPKADNEDWLDAVHIDGIGYDDLRRTIPALLETSTAEQLSLIIRPHGPDAMFIQLDDLTADQLPHLAPTMFLTFETSPGNFQAWLALPCKHDKELERMGLLAPPEQYPALPHARPRAAGNRNWPSYAMCLDGAPLNRAASGPDRSSADFWWCFLAIQWGFGVDDTAEQLMIESEKAREYGKGYAYLTARNAAIAVEKRASSRATQSN